MSHYIRIIWSHDDPECPIISLIEMDLARMEKRKIDIYADARIVLSETGARMNDLGELPVPDLGMINSQPNFKAFELSAKEFETVWNRLRCGVNS